MRKFKVPDPVCELISRLHPALKQKIRNGLDLIREDPLSGKALHDELEGLRSFRISRHRIVYRFSESLIEIVAIGPRKNIYAETFRLLQNKDS